MVLLQDLSASAVAGKGINEGAADMLDGMVVFDGGAGRGSGPLPGDPSALPDLKGGGAGGGSATGSGAAGGSAAAIHSAAHAAGQAGSSGSSGSAAQAGSERQVAAQVARGTKQDAVGAAQTEQKAASVGSGSAASKQKDGDTTTKVSNMPFRVSRRCCPLYSR